MDQHLIGPNSPLTLSITLVNPNTSLAETLGVNEVNQGLQALPSVLTTAFGQSTRMLSAYFTNNTGGALNVTLQDANGNAAVGPSFSVPALSNLLINFGQMIFWGGVKWKGDAGTLGMLRGLQ
jgi:hypothetical protein